VAAPRIDEATQKGCISHTSRKRKRNNGSGLDIFGSSFSDFILLIVKLSIIYSN
jgi:hypothetical protein